TTARIAFERGPAAEIRRFARRGFGTPFSETGTGRAHPKTGSPENARTSGKMTLPIGSRCLMGLSVMRPRSRAVLSPHFIATHPCADSWNETAKRRTTIWTTALKMFSVFTDDASALARPG